MQISHELIDAVNDLPNKNIRNVTEKTKDQFCCR